MKCLISGSLVKVQPLHSTCYNIFPFVMPKLNAHNCVHQCNNHKSAIGVKLRKMQLKFDNNNAVFEKITAHTNALTPKMPLVIGVKVDTLQPFLKIEQTFVVRHFQCYIALTHTILPVCWTQYLCTRSHWLL